MNAWMQAIAFGVQEEAAAAAVEEVGEQVERRERHIEKATLSRAILCVSKSSEQQTTEYSLKQKHCTHFGFIRKEK